MNKDTIFQTIEQLVLLHSPSGFEQEIDHFLLAKLSDLGLNNWQDKAADGVTTPSGFIL